MAELQQFCRVGGALIILFDGFIFAGLQTRGGNFVHLETQEVQLLRVGFLVHNERRLLICQLTAAVNQFGKSATFLCQTAKSIQNGKLSGRVKQRLMIVRTVNVHQPFADGRQRVQAAGGTVDELAVGAGAGKAAFENKLILLAGLQAVFFEKRFQRRFEVSSERRRQLRRSNYRCRCE